MSHALMQAICTLRPGAQFSIHGAEIEWLDTEQTQPTAEEITAELARAAVPLTVTPLQGLLAIDAAGFSAAYDAWAANPARTFAERAFIQKAQHWRRDDPLLHAATVALGLNAAALDALFIAAAQL